MTSFERPWDIRVWLYPDAGSSIDATQWGLEEDITSYVKFPGSDGGQSIIYRAGRRGESAVGPGAVDASEMNLSLDNKDGRFCPDKADGPYWPNLDLNTPIRMGVVTGFDDFARPASTSLGTASCGQEWTHGTSWDLSGSDTGIVSLASANAASVAYIDDAQALSFDITTTAWVTATATGAALFVATAQYLDGDNNMFLGAEFKTDGTVAARIYRELNGSIATLAHTDPIPSLTYTANERFRIRGIRDGATVAVKVWKDADDEPADWDATATETELPAGNLGLYAWRYTSNTNSSLPQFAFDDVEMIGLEFTGYVTEWPTDWNMKGNNSWAAIKAAGFLRRLRQARSTTPLSSLLRKLPTYDPTSYWPLEDGADARVFGSAVPGRQPAKFTHMTLANDDTLLGTKTAPTFNAATGSITAFNVTDQNGQGFSVMFLAKFASEAPASKTRLFSVTTNRGVAVRVDASISHNGTNGLTYIDAFDTDGASLLSTSFSATSVTTWAGDWYGFCLKVYLDSGVTRAELHRWRVGDLVGFVNSGTFASGLTPWAKTITIGGTNWDGMSVAHLWCGLETLPFITYGFFNAASGFDGETAAERWERLGSEASIPVYIEDGDTVELGPQQRLRVVENMQAAADADAAIMYEHGNGLGFRPRAARRNQPVLMALSVPDGHLAEPPKPIRDDQRIRNKITVSRTNGSSAVAEDADSIDRVGEYEESVSLNLYDDSQLQAHAELLLFAGTRRGMRWPGVRLDFARNPDLVPTWRSRTFGFRLTVDTGLTQVRGADPDLLAEGYTASLDPLSWTVDLECSDATLWDTGIYDDGVSKYGPKYATLDVAIDDNDTSIDVDAGGETWVTGAVSWTIAIGGEHITVTNVSGPVSGVYTFTASARSVNGVVKSHDVGESVTFANQARYGF